jgi:hypothetical protein
VGGDCESKVVSSIDIQHATESALGTSPQVALILSRKMHRTRVSTHSTFPASSPLLPHLCRGRRRGTQLLSLTCLGVPLGNSLPMTARKESALDETFEV